MIGPLIFAMGINGDRNAAILPFRIMNTSDSHLRSESSGSSPAPERSRTNRRPRRTAPAGSTRGRPPRREPEPNAGCEPGSAGVPPAWTINRAFGPLRAGRPRSQVRNRRLVPAPPGWGKWGMAPGPPPTGGRPGRLARDAALGGWPRAGEGRQGLRSGRTTAQVPTRHAPGRRVPGRSPDDAGGRAHGAKPGRLHPDTRLDVPDRISSAIRRRNPSCPRAWWRPLDCGRWLPATGCPP